MLELVFVLSAAAVAYTFAGYPLLIRWLASRRPAPVRHGSERPPVAIVVVAFDEAERIEAKVATCLAQDYPADRLTVVVVSDGSTDATVARAEAAGSGRVETVAFPRRRGKAACLNDVVPRRPEPIVVLTDVRQMLSGDAVSRLVAALGDPGVGAASGELVFRTDEATGFGESIDAYWRYEKAIRRAESRFDSCVGVTGALYALRRELFVPIPDDTVLDDVLIPMNVVAAGHRVVFEDRAVAYDRPAVDLAQERTRKTRTLAGNFQLIASHPWLLSPRRNPAFLQFASHKAARLAVPFALLAMLVSSALLALSGTAWGVVLALQVLGYALPAAGRLSPALGRLRIVRMAVAFVALNWFVVLGLIRYLRSSDMHLWQVTRAASPPRGGDAR